MSRFQTIFLGILIVLGVAGAVVFATSKNRGTESATPVVMWGTFPTTMVDGLLSEANLNYKDTVNVSYIEKPYASFESELISALARGQGPDMVLIPQDLIVKQLDKYYIVPFESYSERDFRNSFIQEGELFLASTGIIGFPLAIDPMVMYWNRDILTNEGVSLPPASWTEFFSLAPKIVKKDGNGNISQAILAFGEFRNVSHAKEILSLLAMQAGTPIVAKASAGGYQSVFSARGSGLVPGEEAVSYFTEFSNPSKASYSWNRSLPLDRTAFLAGRLAFYFGYASELTSLRAANPNLNFDVAMVPQVAGKKLTFGRIHGIALLKSSPNVASAYLAATTLVSSPLQQTWVAKSGYPPVRRDLLSVIPGDAYKSVFYQSALVSSAWLDPYREATDGIFLRLVEGVTSGRLRVSEAVSAASTEIQSLLLNTNI
ncbi:MAG: extracellular solute-binding protein [Candidatus Taylorbacteria bacterium]|nr:extracellular solute-binding protein [Candidatus Taylorbacteria bacterium]